MLTSGSKAPHERFLRSLATGGRARCNLWNIPLSTIPPYQLIGFLRTPCSSFIGINRIGRHVLPHTGDAVDDAPGGFNFVAANEKRRISNHAVGNQALVRIRLFDTESALIREIHVYIAEMARRSRNLGCKSKGHTFVRLNAYNQLVR